ncbi:MULTISPECIES: 6-phospho-3-hexuloisomerase [unclassified Breznakia]|uniref:6-phospho-3-hexuloisomerase n=1 Tax=unclassified Breznakia TaxID=2623764 RepID=UPI00240604AD|nr:MULTISPECIES: 6-phospho-3-hexuloisomerase [unclassified Breznakia]MDF9837066.1 6-phospho-3-hexuloisomerase [Breznakia sp. PFB2-8]MDF9858991.1 6-phospho-3-hexuloisomerase [Breznakia sp. PH5-24]
MEVKNILDNITKELAQTIHDLDEAQLQELEKQIKKADKIFVAGAGRSLMMIRGLAMRLMHMGFTAYVVGETVTPAIEEDDLLIIASGSGSTSTLAVMAEKCKKTNVKLALITANKDSIIGKLADFIIDVKTTTSKGDKKTTSIQPGGNTFEQMVLLLGDAIIIDITSSRSLDENNAILMGKHANLE